MRLTIGRHLFVWDPVSWLHHLFLYGKFKKQTLDRTMHWHDILSDFIDDMPDNIPAAHIYQIQELRRDIGHYRIELMENNIERLGYSFENRKNSPIVPE